MPEAKETQTLLVSVNNDVDQDDLMDHLGKQVGAGWTVIQHIPISGGGMGPGGNSEEFTRYQVTVERSIDGQGVVVDEDADSDDS